MLHSVTSVVGDVVMLTVNVRVPKFIVLVFDRISSRTHFVVKRTVKIRYKFGSLKRLFCADNDNASFTGSFKPTLYILMKTCETVVTSQPPFGTFSTTTGSCLCDWH